MILDFNTELGAGELADSLWFARAAELKAQLLQANPKEAPERILEPQNWNIAEFNKPHLPIVIGPLQNPDDFSAYKEEERIRVLDMALHMPGQGWHVPVCLGQFYEAILMAANAEKAVNPDAEQRFVHITIDQKIVPPNKPGRRLGLHSDVGLTDEFGRQVDVTAENRKYIAAKTGISDHAYIIHDVLPTEFYPGPFSLDNPSNEARSFEDMVGDQEPVTYNNHTMLRLNAYDIHTSVRNGTDQPVQRTFFKIQFTERLLDRNVNTINPHFDYDLAR